MTCEEAVLLISARLDGEIAAEDRGRLADHLADCAGCAATAEAFELQDADLRSTFAERRRAAEALADRVAVEVSDVAPAPRALPRNGPPPLHLVGAGLAAAALFVAVVLYRPVGRPLVSPRDVALDLATVGGLTARPRAARPAEPLPVGATVATGDHERRRWALPDGSTVFLAEGSRVTLTSDRRLTLDPGGEVYIEAAASKEPFVLTTPGHAYTAAQGKFSVRTRAPRAGLVVARGSVHVAGRLGESSFEADVSAGHQLDAATQRVTAAPRSDVLLDWTRDLMTEADTPLVPGSRFAGGALVAVDASGQEARLELRRFHVDVSIEDGFARTTIDQTYFNQANWRLEGTFHFPLPPDASLSRLAMYVDGQLQEGGMVERNYARQVYERILYSQRDPALLEWVDGSTFKMRVFPLEPRQEKRIVLSYTQKLPADYGRLHYRFPAGHSLDVVRDWSFHARVRGGAPLRDASSPLSPSHPNMTARVEGADLLLDDRARGVALKQDIVLELGAWAPEAAGEQVRFNSVTQDGQRYLMLRYRPEWPAREAKRTRRDWVFLFEASGDRDPLLARTQIEILRHLLSQAEPDDTFAVLTAGTKVRRFAPERRPVTPENVQAALDYLDKTHLIGALDLGKALAEVEPFLASAANPYLVHLGSGTPAMGERRNDVLAKRVPGGTRYVGVGVGKRWNRAFMKSAAERSGGHFTQINPDEPISWRSFQLASVLALPRLLDIRVADETGRPFLSFATSAVHGEEAAAVARFDADAALPRTVIVTGDIDGQPYRRELPVANVVGGAGYLPRTWAKLEIDRLLAEDAAEHKEAIIALSKAMYVMTPFTSLLVLENEQMYRDFKVDRGRKDHWAMYPCPEKVPVVYEPDPNSPVDPRTAAGQRPTRQQVLQTILVRVPPRCLTGPGMPARSDGVVVTALQLQEQGIPCAAPVAEADTKLIDELRDGRSDLRNVELGWDRSASVGLQGFDGRDALGRAWDVSIPGIALSAGDVSGAPQAREDRPVSVVSPVELLAVRRRTDPRADDGLSALAFSPDGRVLSTGGERLLTLWDAAPKKRIADAIFDQKQAERDLLRHDFNVFFLLGDLAEKARAAPVGSTLLGGRSADRLLRRQFGSAPSLYGRPSFSGDERLFSDLLAYAPGMNTRRADIEAVVEAEAVLSLAQLSGTIDPAARVLIDRARARGWQKVTLPGPDDKPGLTIVVDGAGRYAYARTLASGLRETVVCDGTTLQHLYPDLGVGASRRVSRFHRAELAALVPWSLPPAEDLARGHDVTAIDAATVAVRPRRRGDDKPPAAEWRLVFADGRLAERRLVTLPEGKTVYSEVYAADGVVRLCDGDGKEQAKRSLRVEPASAPELAPDTSALVVLPLPYRSRERLLTEFGLDPQRSLDDAANACFADLPTDDALALLAACVAAPNPHEAALVHRHCFPGDRRAGFYTLLASCGGAFGTSPAFAALVRERPADPLLRYLSLVQYPYYRPLQVRVGLELGSAGLPDAPLFQALGSFRDRWLRWANLNPGAFREDGLKAEQRRGLAFVRRYAGTPFGWAMLSTMSDRPLLNDASFWGDMADAYGRFVDHPALGYAARYERARALLAAGRRAEARQLYEVMFAEALKADILPALDTTFRDALRGEGAEADRWNGLMRETAAALVRERRRSSVVSLAWQCEQLGDAPLAANLLDVALQGADAEERPAVVLAAVAYLSQTDHVAAADELLTALLKEEKWSRVARLWRWASDLAEKRGQTARSIACLEQALALEYEDLPEVIDLEGIRRDYGRLLEHYQSLARTIATLAWEAPRDLIPRTIRAADRWRALDRESDTPCQSAATTLRLLGAPDLAWEYLTTPLGQKPNEVGPWRNLAQSLAREGQTALADQAYATAFEAEPTNADILWERTQNLRRAGREAEARPLLRQLAEGDWEPRFAGVRAQARWQLEGR